MSKNLVKHLPVSFSWINSFYLTLSLSTPKPSSNLLFINHNSPLGEAITLGVNGRNYMQLGIAGCFPVEPHGCCCGLRTLLSAPKPQLTY